MKTIDSLKTKQVDASYLPILMVLLFCIIPSLPLGKSGGGIAMVAVSAIGLIGYAILWRDSLRGRMAAATLVVSMAVGVGAAIVWFTFR